MARRHRAVMWRGHAGLVMAGTLDEQYAEAVRAAEMYGLTWWSLPENVMASDRLRRFPALRAQLHRRAGDGEMIASREVFAAALGWDPPRADAHSDLLRELAGVQDGSGLPPHVYFTLGAPGSGKTSILRQLALRHAQAAIAGTVRLAVSDADAIRERLPEYAAGKGSAVLQDEVAVLAYGDAEYPTDGGLQQRILAAVPGTAVLVIDVVGDRRYLPDTVVSLADDGWDVFVLQAECPIQTCLERVRQRAIATGRIVDLAYVRSAAARPARALSAAVNTGRLTGWARVDTSGAGPYTARVLAGDDARSFGEPGDLALPAAEALAKSRHGSTKNSAKMGR